MRREEICQLQRADVRQEDNVWVFDINARNERTTKTEAGLLLVPIHPKLIEMGFLEFCSDRAKGRDTGNLWVLSGGVNLGVRNGADNSTVGVQ